MLKQWNKSALDWFNDVPLGTMEGMVTTGLVPFTND
jgi:hypothetical protein